MSDPLQSFEFPDPVHMKRAIELSRQGMQLGDGGPFGAVIVRSGEVIGEGWNRVIATNDSTAHAEIVAIRDASRRLSTFDLAGCDLYASSEPCPMCLSAAYWARLERLCFGNTVADAAAIGFDDTFILDELCKPPLRRQKPSVRFMAAEALTVFAEFQSMPNRVRY